MNSLASFVKPGRSTLPNGWMRPDLGQGVHALMSARTGGVSTLAYGSCNVGAHVGDHMDAVMQNRQFLAAHMAAQPVWLNQVHGHRVLRLHADHAGGAVQDADGAVCTERGLACVVMVADCLPILLSAPDGKGVAALHAGWRGLAGVGHMQGRGIVETGVAALCEATSCDPSVLRAWLGPCIGPSAFEVGVDVLNGFGLTPSHAGSRFTPRLQRNARANEPMGQRWWADLPGLTRDRLMAQGVLAEAIAASEGCTVCEPSRYFSFRRDGITGRQAACIALC